MNLEVENGALNEGEPFGHSASRSSELIQDVDAEPVLEAVAQDAAPQIHEPMFAPATADERVAGEPEGVFQAAEPAVGLRGLEEPLLSGVTAKPCPPSPRVVPPPKRTSVIVRGVPMLRTAALAKPKPLSFPLRVQQLQNGNRKTWVPHPRVPRPLAPRPLAPQPLVKSVMVKSVMPQLVRQPLSHQSQPKTSAPARPSARARPSAKASPSTPPEEPNDDFRLIIFLKNPFYLIAFNYCFCL